jgi:hypothetical protein
MEASMDTYNICKMNYYTIENLGYSLCSVPLMDGKEFFKARKENLKITSILWVSYDAEIDPYFIDAVYVKQFPILIFLN